jgi:SAM-dependent methyltransferase
MTKVSKTKKTLKDKWVNNPDLAFDMTLKEDSEIFKWILNRNGFKDGKSFSQYLKGKKRILDAGCGNGRVTALLRKYAPKDTEIIGIDVAPIAIAQKNLKKRLLDHNVKFFKKDLLGNLKDFGKFDFIYCQEVLHHTANPQKSFHNLGALLEKGGEIAIYVYKKKAPVREFVDDFIREKISKLSYKEAMKVCEEITNLGKSLFAQKAEVKVPKVDILEIQAGEYDFQRFIYHHFMKCFWNPELSFKGNVAINFDWYHPQICERYIPEEIRDWFKKEKLKINHEFVDHYGITMKGKNAY